MDRQDSGTPDSSGVSRSGRVRKKSARLTEFESSEESDAMKSPKSKSPSKSAGLDRKNDSSLLSDSMDSTDSETDGGLKGNVDDSSSDSSDEETTNARFATRSKASASNAQGASLYLSEKKPRNQPSQKETKKKKKGKKSDRKDKPPTRYTGYMLWAKEARADLLDKNPHMEFKTISKKLAELWSKVSSAQKQTYNRMAKKLTIQEESATPTSQMIRTGKGTSKKAKVEEKKPKTKENNHSVMRNTNQVIAQMNAARELQETQKQAALSQQVELQSISAAPTFRVNGVTPIDVSAHLKLLGESLNNIGQKLKENEGQIAVSGSLSVLLDSMLCVLGPLACLTEQLEETKGAIGEDTLSGILDNIAYIMPGIV